MNWKLDPIITETRFEVYGLTEKGRCYAKEFIKNCCKGNTVGAKALLKKLDSLSSTGKIDGDKAFKTLRSNLYEIKVKDIRLFCFIHGEKIIILLDGINKNAGKDKQTAAIERAEKMKNEYLKSLRK